MKKNILLTFLTILVLLNSTAIGYYIYHDQKEHQENEEPPFFLMKSSDVDFPTTFSLAGDALRTEGDADNLDAAKDALPKFLPTPSTRRVTGIYLVKYTTTGKRNFPFHEVATAVS